jgi:hypothetical protein
MIPPSGTAWPMTLCPPHLTPISMSCSRAWLIAATTSPVFAHFTMALGCRSTMAFQTARAASYPASPGRMTWPATRSCSLLATTFCFLPVVLPTQCSTS